MFRPKSKRTFGNNNGRDHIRSIRSQSLSSCLSNSSSRQRLPPCYNLLVSNAPAAAKLAGAFLFLSALANLASMRNIDHENDEPAVIDVAQDSVVTDPVSPHACQVSRQCLAPASWVFELRYLVKLVKHPRGNALIELAHRLVGVPREINSPGHSAPLPRRCCRSQACQHDSPRYP